MQDGDNCFSSTGGRSEGRHLDRNEKKSIFQDIPYHLMFEIIYFWPADKKSQKLKLQPKSKVEGRRLRIHFRDKGHLLAHSFIWRQYSSLFYYFDEKDLHNMLNHHSVISQSTQMSFFSVSMAFFKGENVSFGLCKNPIDPQMLFVLEISLSF